MSAKSKKVSFYFSIKKLSKNCSLVNVWNLNKFHKSCSFRQIVFRLYNSVQFPFFFFFYSTVYLFVEQRNTCWIRRKTFSAIFFFSSSKIFLSLFFGFRSFLPLFFSTRFKITIVFISTKSFCHFCCFFPLQRLLWHFHKTFFLPFFGVDVWVTLFLMRERSS